MSPGLEELSVAVGTFAVPSEPTRLTATLFGALALCLHDEKRGVGGLLHLAFAGDAGRPSDVTDATLNGVLAVLDRFKGAVLGKPTRADDVQGRILAHALPPQAGEPSASLVDLIKADLVDGRIICGTQIFRRPEPVNVCFEPFEGRIWVAGPMPSSRPSGLRQRA